ncbi:vacuolar protein sorting-associated protein 5 [Monosporozyma unispora]|nr:Vacuolar protein sorting-associated protein 5 [Kazachstania unispora]
MENSYYRGDNNEYDDLEAPVWSDIGDNKGDQSNHNTVNELSQTFANINVLDAKPDESSDKEVYQSSQSIEQPNIFQTETPVESVPQNHDNLLAKLAPEDNSLTNLQEEANIISAPKGTEDPLFSGNMFASPLKIDDNAFAQPENELSNSGILKKSPSQSHPQQLFNGKRLRRREIPVDPLGNDPLGKAQKDNEFVDEDLTKDETLERKSNSNSKNADILKQMESPLYKLSPRKESLTEMEPEKLEETKATDDALPVDEVVNDEGNELKEELVPFKIEVKDPIKIAEMTSSHIEYLVQSNAALLPSGTSQVRRRYRDFRWLYRQLQSNHWGKIIPPPPEKQAVGRFRDDFVEGRRFQMESMLNRIANDPALQKDDDFIFFLSSETFTKDSKLREYMSGSCAYNDDNDLSEIHISEIQLLGAEDAAVVLKNGGLDAENNRGFMNLSFSSPPKYIEQDTFFLQEYDKLTLLEMQLKQLYKSFDLIDTQRNELSSTIEEFANILKSLAKLEVTKQSSELITNFAEVQDKLKLILERNSLQDSLTMAATVDEYIRSLASVKATFKQRRKIGYFLGIVEVDLNKKMTQFNKQTNNGQQQIEGNDRLLKLRKECDVLQARHDKISNSFHDITKSIKKELTAYSKDKINDFRNSIEISLEGAIESQKECIEAWETFFQTNL